MITILRVNTQPLLSKSLRTLTAETVSPSLWTLSPFKNDVRYLTSAHRSLLLSPLMANTSMLANQPTMSNKYCWTCYVYTTRILLDESGDLPPNVYVHTSPSSAQNKGNSWQNGVSQDKVPSPSVACVRACVSVTFLLSVKVIVRSVTIVSVELRSDPTQSIIALCRIRTQFRSPDGSHAHRM